MNMQNQTPHSHVPYKEDGHCHFSEHSLICFDIVADVKPIIIPAVERIPLQGQHEPFVICDYGAADGAASNSLFRDIIKWLKAKYGAEQQVHVIYEDQAVNDFKSIFMQTHGMLPGRPSYLQEGGVFVTACGTSFYSQVLPDNSVHLAYSSTAFHWLSKRPCQLSDSAFPYRATDPDEVKQFTIQASLDWNTILFHRANELIPGGQMVLVLPCKDNEGYCTGILPGIKHGFAETLDRLWKKMFSMNEITEDEFKAATHNVYVRTEDELVAPFLDVDSSVSKAGLRLLHIGVHWTECVHSKNWDKQLQKDHTTARQHAVCFVSSIRTWSNYTYLAALSSSRTDQVKQELVDELFQMCEDEVAAAPGDYDNAYCHAYMHIEKMTADH